MKYLKNRLIVLMLMLMIPNAWTLADNCYLSDNHHPIQIKASHVQGLQLLMLVKYTYIAQNNMKLANQHYLHK